MNKYLINPKQKKLATIQNSFKKKKTNEFIYLVHQYLQFISCCCSSKKNIFLYPCSCCCCI